MNNFVQVLTACQQAGGAGKKAAIQTALALADEGTRALIWHALNPYLTYGVRQYDKPSTYSKAGMTGYGQFLDLLQALSSRTLSGNAAREAVTNNLALYPKEQADLLELVLEKDLAAGFSADTYNKVWSEKDQLYGTIPTFEVMLADKCESPEEFEEKITFPCQADWKYDGNRCVAFVRHGQPVEYRARSGKVSDHLDGLFDNDLQNLAKYIDINDDIVVDCEAFASDFTETMNAKKTDNVAAKANMRLHLFFVMSMSDWMAQSCAVTMRQGRQLIIDALDKATKNGAAPQKIMVTDGREVKSYTDMVAYTNEVIDVHKQEGLILKNWDSLYQWDRTMDWCKVKRMYDIDAKIVGWYKGKPKSRLANTVGGLLIEGFDEKGRHFKCKVGSGFSDEVRADILANYETKYDGKTAVVTYQEITQAKDSEFWALRFSVYNHIRDDKEIIL